MSDGSLYPVGILGTGSYVPSRVLTNKDLEKIVDTTEEWIVSRTGMRERRVAAPGEAASHMGAAAAKKAIDGAGILPSDIGVIITATSTPDMTFPSTSCFIQEMIGATKAFCFDLSAACSGLLYGIEVARGLVSSGQVRFALVIGSEKMTDIVDWKDRSTCVLFGDGAGAAVLGPCQAGKGILYSACGSDGSLGDLLTFPGGGSRHPSTPDTIGQGLHTIKMKGREVFKHAVTRMADAASKALAGAGLSIDDIACIVPHQANDRIISAIGDRVGAPYDKFYVNVDRYGNTSAASVGIALDEAVRTGRIRSGDLVLLVVFGSGFTWGSTIVRWI